MKGQIKLCQGPFDFYIEHIFLSSVFSSMWYSIMQTWISRIKHQAYSRFRSLSLSSSTHVNFIAWWIFIGQRCVLQCICCFQKNFPPHSLVSLNWGSATRRISEEKEKISSKQPTKLPGLLSPCELCIWPCHDNDTEQ